MNQVMLTGRLSRDPEVRYTKTGSCVANMTIAVDRPVKQGEEKKADFIRIKVFGKQAENAERYLSKGRQIAVTGRIETGSFKDKDGKTVYTTDIVAQGIEYLGGGNERREPDPRQQEWSIPDEFAEVDDDIRW